MRNKIISFIALTVFIISAFFMPLTAYAAELPDETEPPVISDETPDPIDIGEPDADELDFAALLKLFNMLGASGAEQSESAIPQNPDAFTPDGHATVQDWYYGWNDSKEFYTFKTPAGSVFYLIIDHSRTDNNVYFLNAVTESDLIALAEKAGDPISGSESAIPTTTQKPPAGTDNEPGDDKPADGEEIPPPKDKDGGNTGMIIFIVIAALAFGGAGVYIKIIRPKQQAADNAEDDEDEPEGDDDDIPFADEPEETEADIGEDDYIDTDDGDMTENGGGYEDEDSNAADYDGGEDSEDE